ncbi:MAG TPA: hypothetical protein DGC76_11205 [Candidatus Accumulibacter sp.]|nr:hypothetical protein [Accumulibacter sp.]
MADSARRRLWLALLASLLAHAALLAPAYRLPQRPPGMAVQPVVAMIAYRSPVPGEVDAATAATPASVESRRRPVRERQTTAAAASPRLTTPARPVIEQSAAPRSDDSPPMQPRPSRSPPPEPLSASGVTASGATAVAQEVPVGDSRAGAATPAAGISADDLRHYRIELAIASRRFKRYPALARERGWQGRVEVAVSVSAWQPRPQFSLARSSGHAALDRQAVAMLEQASAETALPAGLRGRDFRILLPVEFTLDDAR